MKLSSKEPKLCGQKVSYFQKVTKLELGLKDGYGDRHG